MRTHVRARRSDTHTTNCRAGSRTSREGARSVNQALQDRVAAASCGLCVRSARISCFLGANCMRPHIGCVWGEDLCRTSMCLYRPEYRFGQMWQVFDHAMSGVWSDIVAPFCQCLPILGDVGRSWSQWGQHLPVLGPRSRAMSGELRPGSAKCRCDCHARKHNV